jgi:hypothetical protein
MAEQKKQTAPRKKSSASTEAKPKATVKAKTASAKKAAPKQATAAKPETPRAKKAAASGVSEDMRLHMIREAAYYRALHRGFGGGAETEDWCAAEREIDVMLGKLTK